MPVILKVTQSSVATDLNGLASIVPSSSGFSPPLEVDVTVTAGIGAWLDYPLEVFAPLVLRNEVLTNEVGGNSPSAHRPPLRILGRDGSEERSRPEVR